MAATQALQLSQDQALVLFELLARFEETDRLTIEHAAEFLVLSSLARQLQKSLVEPFATNYAEIIERAQAKIAQGFEGLAPGMAGYGA